MTVAILETSPATEEMNRREESWQYRYPEYGTYTFCGGVLAYHPSDRSRADSGNRLGLPELVARCGPGGSIEIKRAGLVELAA